jgi:hypothetical protein
MSARPVDKVGETYLNAVVAVSEVLHRLELLIDDTNAGLVCTVYDTLNILGALAHCLQFLVQALSSFNSSLRVELSWKGSVCTL